MEFLLLLGIGVLLIVLMQRTKRLHEELTRIGTRLERLAISPVPPATREAAAGFTPPDISAPFVTPSPPRDVPPQPASYGAETVVTSAPQPPPIPPAPEPAPEPPPIPTPEPAMAADATPPEGEPPPQQPPPPPPQQPSGPTFGDLEKRFGTQWVVWIGGVALALGGIFLVRYSIEAGLFGPGLRVLAGALLALVLVGLGERARRREVSAGMGAQASIADIPSILTAAGTTCAYADVWAAYALYHFLSPGVAFVLLGLVALATLAAALRHGPALAGLGLIGAYVTPALVASAEPNYWALYVYLAVVTAAAYALARVRLWRWLAITAAAFSVLWMFAGISDPRGGSLSAHAFHAVAGFALAAYFLVAGLFKGPPIERGHAEPVSWGVLCGYLFGAFMLVLATRHDGLALTTLFVLMAATVAICWRTDSAFFAMPGAALLGVLVIVHWALSWWFITLVSSYGVLPSNLPWQIEIVGISSHTIFALGTALLFGVAGYLAQERTEQVVLARIWSAVAVATPVLLLIGVYYRIAHFERSIPFAGIALLLAAAFAWATEKFWKREQRAGISEATALFAVGAVASLALTLTFALERGWLTVSLSLMVPGIAWIADKRPVPMLRKLCGILVAVVLARVTWDPRIVGANVGTTPIINWLLWGYGVPAVAFWIAGRIMRRQTDDVSSRSVDSAAILFTALLAFLEIRHLMNDGDIYRSSTSLGELGLQISTGLAMVIGLEHMRVRSNSVIHDWGARIFAAVAFASILIGLLMTRNPMLTGEPVGGLFFNYVLLGYGIPAVLTAVLARMIRNTRPQPYYIGAAITAIVLMLIYLTLEVRTLFHGSVLIDPYMSDAEDYTYSAVWLAFGVALLIAGIALKSQTARFASAAMVLLTIAKVFLHDLAGVEGIYRALSFIGLGLVLMGIGWLYQRLLFPRRPPPGPETQAAST